MRTVYGENAIGKYIAREWKYTLPGGRYAWLEIKRTYAGEIVTGFPAAISTPTPSNGREI